MKQYEITGIKHVPVNIIKLIDFLGAKAVALRFRHAASGVRDKRKGFAFFRDNTEILTLEPVDYSNGDKWLVTGGAITSTLTYAKSLKDVYKKVIQNKTN